MAQTAPHCPTEDALVELVHGHLSGGSGLTVKAHLDGCSQCRELVVRLITLEQPATASKAAATAPSPRPSGPGSSRYVILDVVGAGGMGVVYAAFDRQLDRKVALKVLRGDVVSRVGQTQGSQDLLHEAQAAARLGHPNVVTVFDAGFFDEQVFVSMEFVEGWTLRRWLAERKRSGREIRDAFIAAGQGLAAAHRAGLVHRDFKPDNVLVGRDGRVRVSDFGLAHEAGPREPGTDDAVATAPVGTPAYMSPEQLRGLPVDARSDQFSFCVALYEALYGRRPFAGSTADEVAEEIAQGRVRAAPVDRRVSWAISRGLQRGLAADPSDRLDSMDALLAILSRDPLRARMRSAGAVLAAIVVVLIGWAFQRVARGRALACEGAGGELAAQWSPAAQQQGRDAFIATQTALAGETWGRVERGVNDYAGRWRAESTQACEATRVRGEQSDEALDLRMACLTQRRHELATVLAAFAQATPTTVNNGPQAVGALAQPEECRDVAALRASGGLPKDPTRRAQARRLRGQLGEVKAKLDLGQMPEALAGAEALLHPATELGDSGLHVETMLLKASILSQTGEVQRASEAYADAAREATELGDDRVAALAWLGRAWVAANLGQPGQALDWLEMGSALVRKLGSPSEMVAQLEETTGWMFLRQENASEAVKHFTLSVAAREAAGGQDFRKLGTSYDLLGEAYSVEGDDQQALPWLRKALAVYEDGVGPEHPLAASAQGAIGISLAQQGRFEEARAALEQELRVLERTQGTDSFLVANAKVNLANVATELDRLDEALGLGEQALAVFERVSGPESESVADALHTLGETLLSKGDVAGAIQRQERALAIYSRSPGPNSLSSADVLNGLGEAYAARGSMDAAVDSLQRAIAIFAKEKSPGLAEPLAALGELELRRHDLAQARATLERALPLLESRPSSARLRGQVRFALARTLWAQGGAADRALQLARSAREDWSAAGRPGERMLAQADSWLAARGRPAQVSSASGALEKRRH